MKSIIKLMLVLVLAVSVTVLFAAAKGDAKKGQDLFTGKCKSCHGDKGIGNPAVEKIMGVKILPFSSKEVQSMTDEQIGKMISDGKDKMPAAKLSQTDTADIIAYIRTLAPPAK
ncbi:MAG: cytochrome c [Acidobacteriota bacterium]|jgi:mono/diheme cytochrome c family protein